MLYFLFGYESMLMSDSINEENYFLAQFFLVAVEL